jgi:hypothetical protein
MRIIQAGSKETYAVKIIVALDDTGMRMGIIGARTVIFSMWDATSSWCCSYKLKGRRETLFPPTSRMKKPSGHLAKHTEKDQKKEKESSNVRKFSPALDCILQPEKSCHTRPAARAHHHLLVQPQYLSRHLSEPKRVSH